jgi:uncharacterized surface protein with fasciclin (FAS1) repeats
MTPGGVSTEGVPLLFNSLISNECRWSDSNRHIITDTRFTYHVLSGKVMAADAKTMEAKTVNGQELSLVAEDGKVTVDKANVIMADVAASNGVIHAIDTVLMPK